MIVIVIVTTYDRNYDCNYDVIVIVIVTTCDCNYDCDCNCKNFFVFPSLCQKVQFTISKDKGSKHNIKHQIFGSPWQCLLEM
jgi:hypothetical protein